VFFNWVPGGRDFALSVVLTVLYMPVVPLEHVLLGLVSPFGPEEAAPPLEQAAFIGRQARVLANSSPRESVASPQIYTGDVALTKGELGIVAGNRRALEPVSSAEKNLAEIGPCANTKTTFSVHVLERIRGN
jgi:hypothetical protein